MSPIIGAIAIAAQAHAPGNQQKLGSCDITHAAYSAAGQHAYHLSFAKLRVRKELVSDLALHIWSSSKKVDLWWFFDEGSEARIALISTPNPLSKGWTVPPPDGGVRVTGSLTFIGAMRDNKIMDMSPKATSQPPYFVIIPEIAGVFYSRGEHTYLPAAFVFKGCGLS